VIFYTPYYDELIGLIKIARTRPSIPEYSQIADNIRQTIDQVYNGTRDPRHAVDEAVTVYARILGW
jgi:multiple sugar transport system substrate-binding protein